MNRSKCLHGQRIVDYWTCSLERFPRRLRVALLALLALPFSSEVFKYAVFSLFATLLRCRAALTKYQQNLLIAK
jgi:hypothetical protein